ncbi:MAG: WecB/TagA/CpsF family glycosyltransferase [Endomicrobiales bacterium]|nr:WecB/TagA/CpsF family glycosyltransferase [Endomicrobiales bacterium]
MKGFKLFGLNFSNISLDESIVEIEKMIKDKTPSMLFSLSAELIVRSDKDGFLKKVYDEAKILTLDGNVVHNAARLLGSPAAEPVSASRIMLRFMETAAKRNYSVYLLGASEEVVKETAETLRNKHPGINIAGMHNGYFDIENDRDVVSDIKVSNPDILFVAMSSPLKERFIYRNLREMNVPVCVGVGGIFDIIAGKCKLAPEWISRIGLEWFYRFIQEPKRLWKRYLITNTKFIFLVVKELFARKGGQ